MKIQIASDLHLENECNSLYFNKNPLIPSAEILILAGDILSWNNNYTVHPFWDKISDGFKEVYIVPGNHEYYDNYDLSLNGFQFDIRENIHLLNNASVIIENIKFIFSTLWSHIPEDLAGPMLSHARDFTCIQNNNNRLSIEDYNSLNEQSISYLKKEIDQNYKKNIVITHHVPLLQLLPVRLKNSYAATLYSNQLDDFIQQKNIHTWIYGHSHYFHPAIDLYETNFSSNPFGNKASKENPYFSLKKCISI